MTLIKIDTEQQLEDLLAGDSFFLLKHSLTCPVSHAAYEEYVKVANDEKDIKMAYLAVQEARLLSNHIADTFSIKHESPQAFLFNNGEPVWNASHWKITKKSLIAAKQEI
ncbi:bacillithiol system redox-active protein YtxJ [Peribacillus alkalitolerans]|uniref:bacillithiol system redox-active protein YtxJ n=1 Tax=Peribacillus alkalitolerans TaxID=1550385 RepID=UPI0013CF6106|nr:bacillithiol system redox-active protein YtxJ [Peribacillus alkalitolerans]